MKQIQLIILLLFCKVLVAQSLQVEVYQAQSQKPLANVAVFLHETEQRFTSSERGRVEVQGLKPGHYHIHFEKEGYRAVDQELYFPEQKHLVVYLTPSFIELNEVLVEESFSRKGNKKTSLNVQSVNADLENQISANSVGEALENLPGISALNTGVGIAKPVIRGFMGNRVAVLDQGIRQEGQQWGLDHGLEIDPFQAQRMELVKGPQALQYGSDAIGGVLKILPDPLPRPGFSGNAATIYRSNNSTYGASAEANYREQQHFLSGRLSYQKYSDFTVPAQTFTYNGFILPITNNTLKNTAGQLLSYRLNYGVQKPDYSARYLFSHFQQQVGLYPGATGIPRAFDVGNIGNTRDIQLPNQQVRHTKFYTKQNIKIGGHWLRIDAGYQRNDRAENSLPHNHGFEELDSSNTLALGLLLQTLSLNANYGWHNQWAEFTVGTSQQYKFNQRNGFEYLIPDFQSYNGGAFLLGEGEFAEKWFWNGGLRLDYGHINAPESTAPWWNNFDSIVQRSPAIDRSFLNYALAAGLAYNPSQEWNLKANLARSFRIPVIAELASNGVHHGTFRHEVGDAQLDSEKGWQLDLGLSYQSQRIYVQLSPFANYFNNFIYLRPSGRFSQLPEAGQLYTYAQAEVFQGGSELFVDWHFLEQLHWSNALEWVISQNLETNLPLPFTPPLSNLMSVKWEVENEKSEWHIGLDWRYTAAQNRVDRNENTTPAYQLFHFKSGYNFTLWRKEWQLNFTVQNLFDTFYLRHLSRYRILNLPEQGRNIVLGLKLAL